MARGYINLDRELALLSTSSSLRLPFLNVCICVCVWAAAATTTYDDLDDDLLFLLIVAIATATCSLTLTGLLAAAGLVCYLLPVTAYCYCCIVALVFFLLWVVGCARIYLFLM
jgi:hypothetical protein